MAALRALASTPRACRTLGRQQLGRRGDRADAKEPHRVWRLEEHLQMGSRILRPIALLDQQLHPVLLRLLEVPLPPQPVDNQPRLRAHHLNRRWALRGLALRDARG